MEPDEILIASEQATYTYAGRLEDGTTVVRDSDGILHALVPVRMTVIGADGKTWTVGRIET